MGSCCSSDPHEEILANKEAKIDNLELEKVKKADEQFQLMVMKNLDEQKFKEEVTQLKSFSPTVNVTFFNNQ